MDDQEAKAGSRKVTGNRNTMAEPPPAVPNNWPDTGSFPIRKGADAVRWACEETMTYSPSTEGQVGRHGTAVVNGPEGEDLDWLSVDW